MQQANGTVPVLILSGSMGTGKTTVLSEVYDLLTEARIAHAIIDLDWLTAMYPRQKAYGHGLMVKNLAAVWPIYAAAGAIRLVVARVVENRSELQDYREAIPGAEPVVCLLTASIETMHDRLRIREPGMFQELALARCEELASILETSNAEDFRVDNNEGRDITERARAGSGVEHRRANHHQGR